MIRHICIWVLTIIASCATALPANILYAQDCSVWGEADGPSISSGGELVAFASSQKLTAADTNSLKDIYVYDRQDKDVVRVSVASNGLQGNGNSGAPSISANGQFVAFESDSSNLVTNDTNDVTDIFVHDRQTGETTRVSINTNGTQGDGGSAEPEISDDGRFVVFRSETSAFEGSYTDSFRDIFVHDRQTGETTRVSSAGGWNPSISGDGSLIVFESSTGLSLYNSVDKVMTPLFSDGGSPAISANGQFIAFVGVVTDTSSSFEVIVQDVQTGDNRAITSQQGFATSFAPSISANGDYIAYAWVGNGRGISIYHRQTNENKELSLGVDIEYSDYSNEKLSISDDGRYVAFYNTANDIVSDDSNPLSDIFLHDRETNTIELISVPGSCGTQAPEYQLMGLVKDENGVPQEWVDVIVNPGNHLLKTDSQGVYTLMVPAGMYTVEVGVPDYTSYPSQQMVEVAQDTTLVPFTYYPCISPHTSLNVCELEVGDILLERSATLAQTVASVFGYWFHSGVFIGGNEVSQAVGLRENDDDEVLNDPIFITNWWTGDVEDNFQDWFDWAVLRPNTDLSTKTQAASYMAAQADRTNPPVVYVPYDQPWEINIYELLAAFRYSEDQVYCNQLAWLSYDKLGLDLEINNPALTALPIESRVFLQNVIFGSDLYASTYHDLSSIQQQRESVVRVAKRMTLSFIAAIVDELAPDAQGASLRDYNAPVRVVVTDSQGRRSGYNSETGEVFNEIPGAVYTDPGYTLETFSFKVLEGEVYTVTVTGIADGDYVVFTRMTGDIEETSDAAQASISTGETTVFTINPFAENDAEIIVEEEEEQPDLFQVFIPILAR